MKPTITIVAPGNMGAAMGARLVDNGLEVRTSLTGRSAASAARANAAGMRAVEGEDLVDVDLFLSVLPPGDAIRLAKDMAALIRGRARRPAYIDCNAVSPATVAEIAKIMAEAGAPFIDGGIIGLPPREGHAGPRLYVSGSEAHRAAVLNAFGLEAPVLDGPVGAASALKMSYAGITKGINAIGTAMVLAAERAGAGAALRAEMAGSIPNVLDGFGRSMPNSFDKAYRWVAEMNEIAAFAGDDDSGADIFRAIAELYGTIAKDRAGPQDKTGALMAFLRKPLPPKA